MSGPDKDSKNSKKQESANVVTLPADVTEKNACFWRSKLTKALANGADIPENLQSKIPSLIDKINSELKKVKPMNENASQGPECLRDIRRILEKGNKRE